MTRAKYKNPRLLTEAINREMEDVRKAAMGNMALGPLNELRDLVKQLSDFASRPTLSEVMELPAAKYVEVMMPMVAQYHLQLAVAGQLEACLCRDLRAVACVLVLVTDERTVVRAARDSGRPEADLAIEAIIESLDSGTKRVAEDGAAALESFAGVDRQTSDPPEYKSAPLTVETLEEAARQTLEIGVDEEDRTP